jgi:hypothetical protein
MVESVSVSVGVETVCTAFVFSGIFDSAAASAAVAPGKIPLPAPASTCATCAGARLVLNVLV